MKAKGFHFNSAELKWKPFSLFTLSNSFLFSVKAIHDNTNWVMMYEEAFPYYIAYGKSSTASCRSCLKLLPKDELRVRTKFLRRASHGSILPFEMNLCLNLNCVQNPSRGFRGRYAPWVSVFFVIIICSNIHHLWEKSEFQ